MAANVNTDDVEAILSEAIWKFPIEITDRQTVKIPGLRRVLHVGPDPSGVPCIWAIVAPSAASHGYTVRVVGTGHPFPSDVAPSDHVGSYFNGPLVWHVFVAS